MNFNFELLGPIVIFDDRLLSNTLEQLYELEIYPLQIITDKNHSIFKDIPMPDNMKPKIIILPFRYLIKFLT